ncbi:hypothetical protein EV691_110109 [Azotobacter chroococcum]|jgi:hypothetical protein|uniref:Uncharacterized protein n=1 Tax=Azotobacter chroococcum TaxID=353 RepID=A0A4R1PQF2_9GAMM|nr:hypothetical protein E0E53_00180 [Azotobacter chroococcum]TCL31928.1 hypothetical protein EV691_110109 [Azotobacter chroococcum]
MTPDPSEGQCLRLPHFALAAMIHRFGYRKCSLVLVFSGGKIFLAMTLGLRLDGVLVSLAKTAR